MDILKLLSPLRNFFSMAYIENAIVYLIALGAWGSLYPYFSWGSLGIFVIGAIMAMVAGVLLYLTKSKLINPFLRLELFPILVLTLFIIYITLQFKVDGDHALWIFVLPTLWILGLINLKMRKQCFLLFSSVFAISLIPSIIIWLLVFSGFEIPFSQIPSLNPKLGGEFLTFPGMVFNISNSIVLPWGGVLFRLCGMYDEPGMVGTISAFILAAFQFRFSDWRTILLYAAGVMSFSLAFMILATIGIVARSIFSRKFRPLLALLPIFLASMLALGFFTVETQSTVKPSISVISSSSEIVETGQDIRQTKYINNRTSPAMEILIQKYWSSSLAVIFFGIASDASVVHGSTSQIWWRVLTNHGIFGFALLLVGFISYARTIIKQIDFSLFLLLFFFIFAISFYQRPVIWMPYAFLIMICGPYIQMQKNRESLNRDIKTR